MKPERRNFTVTELRVERRENESAKISGHAAVFDQLSENLGGFREKIVPGAFIKAIAEDDVRALFNHNPDHVLGRNRSKTLVLAEDQKGLFIEISPPDTQIARDLLVSIERGDITQMSFGFSPRTDGQTWGEDDAGNIIRTLTDVRLYDVSPVTFPAYPQTDVAVRSMQEWQETRKKSEEEEIYSVDLMQKRQDLLESE
jgi:HK97 family phage prohead protease